MNKKGLITENINNLLLAILICVPMMSFIININNIIPITNIIVLVTLLYINRKKIKNVKVNIYVLSYILLLTIIILINIILFRFSKLCNRKIIIFYCIWNFAMYIF